MWWLGDGLVPAGRFLLLAGVCLSVWIVEGGGGVVGTIGTVLLAQALVYLALEWIAAAVATRLVARASPRAVGTVSLGVALLLLLVTARFEVFHTPFGPTAQADLLAIYR